MRDTIEMAHEVLDRMPPDDHCRESYWTATDAELERLVALVRADEREACATVCEKMRSKTPIGRTSRIEALFFAARNIRARGDA